MDGQANILKVWGKMKTSAVGALVGMFKFSKHRSDLDFIQTLIHLQHTYIHLITFSPGGYFVNFWTQDLILNFKL